MGPPLQYVEGVQQLKELKLKPTHPPPPQVNTILVFAMSYRPVFLFVVVPVAGHNRRWIDGSIPILLVNTIDQYY